MRFVKLFANNRSMGRHDVPEVIEAEDGKSFRLYGATRMDGSGVVLEASELADGRLTGRTCAVGDQNYGHHQYQPHLFRHESPLLPCDRAPSAGLVVGRRRRREGRGLALTSGCVDKHPQRCG